MACGMTDYPLRCMTDYPLRCTLTNATELQSFQSVLRDNSRLSAMLYSIQLTLYCAPFSLAR
jgi:hypothetical protein